MSSKGRKSKLSQEDFDEMKGLKDLEEPLDGSGTDGQAESSKFAAALQLAMRAAFFACLMASIVWVPAIRKPFPNALQANLPFATLLLLVMLNPLLGQTLASAMCALTGTLWACLNIWLLRGFFPGGVHDGGLNNSTATVIGYVDHFIYIGLVLICNCSLGMKMFALATHVIFMLEFFNPKSTAEFSDGFAINLSGTALNRLLAIVLACLFAVLANLLPYPYTRASVAMRDRAIRAATGISKLFANGLTYYKGSEASVVIEAMVKHSLELRAVIDDFGTAVEAAWYEGFDFGSTGYVRAHMSEHLDLMNELYDRLRALLVAMSTEDFEQSHKDIMGEIGPSADGVVRTTQKLLIEATQAAGDGEISEGEKTALKGLIQLSVEANKQLSQRFHTTRQRFKTISDDILSENFFVLTLAAYSRLVQDYAEKIMAKPVAPQGLLMDIGHSVKSAWDVSAITDKVNVAFFLRYFIAIGLCWFYSVVHDNFAGGCVITSVFLMKTIVGPDLQLTANVMQAVICALVAITIIFTWACSVGYSSIVLPIVAFTWWTVTLYIKFNTNPFSLIATFAAILSAFKLVGNCPDDAAIKSAANAAGIWGYIVGTITSLTIVATCELFLAVDRNSNLASKNFDEAMINIKKAFSAFLVNKDTAEAMEPVADLLSAGATYNAQAEKEPRFWRNAWKGPLYDELVAMAQQLRLDLLMLRSAVVGSKGTPQNIFGKFQQIECFARVKKDLSTTLEDAHRLSVDLIVHEYGRFDGLQKLLVETQIDTLDDMPKLIDHLAGPGGLAFPEEAAESLEDDMLCQISTVIVMMNSTIGHIAGMIKAGVRNA